MGGVRIERGVVGKYFDICAGVSFTYYCKMKMTRWAWRRFRYQWKPL